MFLNTLEILMSGIGKSSGHPLILQSLWPYSYLFAVTSQGFVPFQTE